MRSPIRTLWFQTRQCVPRRRLYICVWAAVALSTFALCFRVGIRPTFAAPSVIYNLGTLGGSKSSGWGVNNAGQVAGIAYPDGDAGYHTFRYDGPPGAGGVMLDLGASEGLDLNATGQVAGWFERYNDAEGHNEHRAFRYDGSPGAGGIMRDLGTLGGWASFGVGVNDLGQVTGYSMITGNAGDRAFLYTGTPGAGGTMASLGTLGGNYSYGNDINNAGQVTGESRLAGDAFWHAFRYDGVPGRGGIMRDLGTLGGTISTGYAINSSGQVVGTAQTTGDTAVRAFRYTGTPGAGGKMVALEPLGGIGSTAFGINDGGFVVGVDSDVRRNYATLWKNDAAGTPVDLDAWLDSVNPTIGAFWTLLDARDINNNGLITGHGTYDDGPGGLSDGERAYLLDASALIVPEPSAAFILGAVGIGSLLRRRHRKIRRLAYSIQHVTKASPIVMALSAVFVTCTPRVGQAEYLPVYGGPAAVLDDPFGAVSAVNDVGRAVGNNVQYICIDVGCSETIADRRAYRWDAASISRLEGLGTSANGGSVRRASALNGAGTAIGLAYKYDSFGNSLGVRAVRWDSGVTTATELANLGTNPTGSAGSNAVAINDAGVVVGSAHKYDALGNLLGERAVRWDPSGAITELDIPAAGPNATGYPSAINSDGTAAGSAGGRAVRWDASGTAAALLPSVGPQGGALYSFATAINDSGTIVGSIVDRIEANLAVNGVAVRWDAVGAATQLGSVAISGGFKLYHPRAINASGTSVGIVEAWDPFYDESGIIPQFLGTRAVRWDAVGTSATLLGNLGSVPGGSPDSDAYAINSAGVAVGYASAAGLHHAVYWGIDASAIDLNTLIDPDSGWFLISAQDISDTGWIVGVGQFDPDGAGGQPADTRHFLMHVPATAATLPGDFNRDGTVDAADYVVWRKTGGTQDGYNLWRANFGRTAGSGVTGSVSGSSVPEPDILALAAAGFVGLISPGRRRKRHHSRRSDCAPTGDRILTIPWTSIHKSEWTNLHA